MVCVIATNVAPHELLWRPNRRTRFVVMAVLFTTVSLGCNGGHSIRLAYSRETGGRPKVPLEIRQLIRDMSLRYVLLLYLQDCQKSSLWRMVCIDCSCPLVGLVAATRAP